MATPKSKPKRRDPSPTVRDEVLRESGYKCANPTCRNILTLQLHHMILVKDGGNTPGINLIALCGHCHDLHSQEHIPTSAIRHWLIKRLAKLPFFRRYATLCHGVISRLSGLGEPFC